MIHSLRRYWLARLLSFKRPLLSVHVSLCQSVCGKFDARYLGNQAIWVSNSDPIGKCARRVDCWPHWWRYATMIVSVRFTPQHRIPLLEMLLQPNSNSNWTKQNRTQCVSP